MTAVNSDREREVTRVRLRVVLPIALLVFFASLTPAPAWAVAGSVDEFPLGPNDLFPGAIAPGPGGEMWFGNPTGTAGRTASEQRPIGMIDRISPSGQITTFSSPEIFPSALAAGSDGNMWFAYQKGVGRITPAGQVTTFPVHMDFPNGLAAGPDGNLWLTARQDSGGDRIVRVSTTGQIAEFPIPTHESGPGGIAAGSDGNMWFTEYFGRKIGRIGPTGGIVEFRLPSEHSTPRAITQGPDGNIWFTKGGGVGRVTPDGQITEFPAPGTSGNAIEAGSDGRLWFTKGQGSIGRLNPISGRVTEIRLPNRESYPVDIAAGPDGSIWYTAHGEGPCEGGGGTCMAMIYKNPGMVGRITSGKLAVGVKSRRVLVSHRWARIKLGCEGGHADSVCRGRVRLTTPSGQMAATHHRPATNVPVGSGRYRLAADERRTIAIRLRSGLALSARNSRLRAKVKLSLSGGRSVSRSVVLVRKPR